MVDKVKALKIENPSLGGTETDPFPKETDPTQDYLAAKGVAFENNDNRLLNLDGSGNIQSKDATDTTAFPLYRRVKDFGTPAHSLLGNVATLANTTTTLVRASNTIQIYTGSTSGQILKLPDATTLEPGHEFQVWNNGSQSIAVRDGSNAALFTLGQTSVGFLRLQSNSTTAGIWIYYQIFISSLASGILNYTLVSSTVFSSAATGTSYVAITGFTVTPQSGTYAIWYNSTVAVTQSGQSNFCALYKAGTQIADTVRELRAASSNSVMTQSTMTVIALNGSETLDARIRLTGSGTIDVNSRSLILIRLGT